MGRIITVAVRVVLLAVALEVVGGLVPGVGWSLAAVAVAAGLLLAFGIFAGPSLWRSFALSVVRTAREVETADEPPVAGPPVEATHGGRDEATRPVLQRLAGELAYGRKMVERAKVERRYWDPRRRYLPTDEWESSRASLPGTPGLEVGYAAAVSAYYEFERLNDLVEDRWRAVPDNVREMVRLPYVFPQDDLDGALAAIDKASAALTDALSQRPS